MKIPDDVEIRHKGYDLSLILEEKATEEDIGEIEINVKVPYEKVFYIEVKTTTGERVRITPCQANKARESGKRYILCVVQIPRTKSIEDITEEDIEEYARFVENIGEYIKEPQDDRYVKQDIRGYYVKKRLWEEKGRTIAEWIDSIL